MPCSICFGSLRNYRKQEEIQTITHTLTYMHARIRFFFCCFPILLLSLEKCLGTMVREYTKLNLVMGT